MPVPSLIPTQLSFELGAFSTLLMLGHFCVQLPQAGTMKAPRTHAWSAQSFVKCHQPSHRVPMTHGYAGITGYMPVSTLIPTQLMFEPGAFSTLLVLGHFSVQLPQAGTMKAPRTHDWSAQSSVKCHQPSHRVPMTHG